MTTKEPGYPAEHIKEKDETERKWLIDPSSLPDNLKDLVDRELNLRQAYIAFGDDGSEARIRSTNDVAFEFTIKSKGNEVRGESTMDITREMFESLASKKEGHWIEKTRLEIPYGEYTIELDIYTGDLDGLIVTEVEFEESDVKTALEHASDFIAPDWFNQGSGREVTNDKRYKNKSLAVNGLPE